MSIPHWKLGDVGRKFTDGKGTVRELVKVWQKPGQPETARNRRIDYKKVEGKGPEGGSMSWAYWRKWVQDEWLPPRPERLPVPDVTKVDLVFPTDRINPPWHWVPNEFKGGGDPNSNTNNRSNIWCKLVDALLFGGSEKWESLRLARKDGVDAEAAWAALNVTLSSWGSRVEVKTATAAYMFSEWFNDYWFEGDATTHVHHVAVPDDQPA